MLSITIGKGEKMKTTVNRKELVKALQTVKAVVPARSILPILSHVHLTVDEGHLAITGTDLDSAIRVLVNAEMERPGGCTVDCRELLSTLKGSVYTHTTLELIDGKLNIMHGESGFALQAGDINDRPNITFGTDEAAPVLSDEFIDYAARAAKFTSEERMIRPALCGIYVEFLASETVITATDGHRLATYKVPDVIDMGAMIIPSFILVQAAKVRNAIWRIYKHNDCVVLSSAAVKLKARLINPPYPNWRQVMPKDQQNTFTVNRPALLQAVKTLLPCACKVTRQVIFAFSGDTLTLTAEDADRGSHGIETVRGNYVGKDLTVAYNGQFVLDMLAAIASDGICWETETPTSAATVRPYGVDEAGLYIIMPLRIDK